MTIRVRATKKGYFGGRLINEGDVFDIPGAEQMGKTWMVVVPQGAPVSQAPVVEDDNTPIDLVPPTVPPTPGTDPIHGVPVAQAPTPVADLSQSNQARIDAMLD